MRDVKRTIAVLAGSGILALGALVLAPATTAAYVSTSPNSHDFGSQLLGTASPPFTFTLNVRCYPDVANPGTCQTNHPFTPSVSVTGDFAVGSNNCTTLMPGDSFYGTNCTFDVIFLPGVLGARSGIVSVGDPSGFGQAGVTGSGAAPQSSQGTAQPGTVSRKCKKKHRSASTAKKRCKKRR